MKTQSNSRTARIREAGDAGGCHGGRFGEHDALPPPGGNAGAVSRHNSNPHARQDRPETPDPRLRRRRLAHQWGNPLSQEDRVALVRYAFDRGVRYFDTPAVTLRARRSSARRSKTGGARCAW